MPSFGVIVRDRGKNTMFKRFLNWIIYGDCSQEPSDNIEFLKGIHSAVGVKNEDMVVKL